MRNWDYDVKGFRRGQLLLHTTHQGQASKDMEVAAWRARYQRGECDLVEVIDRENGRREVYPPFPDRSNP